MGWLSNYFDGKRSDVRHQIEQDYLSNNVKVIRTAFTSSAYFALIERYDKDTEQFREPFVFVAMYTLKDNELSIKTMSENAGPTVTAPAGFIRYLNKHHPTTAEFALNWRERCLRLEVLKKHGSIIKFDTPLEFTDYGIYDTFRIIRLRGERQYFRPVVETGQKQPFGRFRISNIDQRDFTVLQWGT